MSSSSESNESVDTSSYYDEDFVEYLPSSESNESSSSDEEELVNKPIKKKRKVAISNRKEVISNRKEAISNKKGDIFHNKIGEIDKPDVVNIKCGNLIKGPTSDFVTYNVNVPKSKNIIINLKRRHLKTTSLICCFNGHEIVHQGDKEVVLKN